MSNVLIMVEAAEGGVKKSSLAAITFGQQLAAKRGTGFDLAVIGKSLGGASDAVKGFGAGKVFVFDNDCFENFLSEAFTAALNKAVELSNASFIAAATSTTSKDVLTALASKHNASMASDVLEIVDAAQFKRPMWAGNVIATVELSGDKQVATVRATEFDAPAAGAESAVEAVDFSVDVGGLKTKFISLSAIESERPDATVADVVVAGGRGLKEQQHFKLIEDLADKLGGGVGASRAICDAGWVPNDMQIGQTGKVVAPNLYFAVGISGAIQHLAGMKGSKCIVAINKDPEAPIFQVADYGLVADLFDVMPGLINDIK